MSQPNRVLAFIYQEPNHRGNSSYRVMKPNSTPGNQYISANTIEELADLTRDFRSQIAFATEADLESLSTGFIGGNHGLHTVETSDQDLFWRL